MSFGCRTQTFTLTQYMAQLAWNPNPCSCDLSVPVFFFFLLKNSSHFIISVQLRWNVQWLIQEALRKKLTQDSETFMSEHISTARGCSHATKYLYSFPNIEHVWMQQSINREKERDGGTVGRGGLLFSLFLLSLVIDMHNLKFLSALFNLWMFSKHKTEGLCFLVHTVLIWICEHLHNIQISFLDVNLVFNWSIECLLCNHRID